MTAGRRLPLDLPKAPDLQVWINRYGGYDLVDWEAWHRANYAYQQARRQQMLRELNAAERSPRKASGAII
jgi:hypothetical protein